MGRGREALIKSINIATLRRGILPRGITNEQALQYLDELPPVNLDDFMPEPEQIVEINNAGSEKIVPKDSDE